jgi:predicted amidohydrolase YtcJ
MGDEWLRWVGIGEVVHFGCHDFEGLDDFAISAAARGELMQISAKVAARGLPMHIHAVMDDSIAAILDCWEEVDRITPIRPLRFSIAHADRIGPDSIARAAALGIGLVVDARLVFRSAASRAVWGEDALHTAPPLRDILAAGIPLAVGSDATRASSYNPWLATWWLVAGRSLDGGSQRDAPHLLARHEALAAQTIGGAWLSSEETQRGMLRAGWLADFAVLSDDCFMVPDEQIAQLRSELTVVGGDVAFSSGVLVDQA